MEHIIIGRFLVICICLFVSAIAFGVHFGFLSCNPTWSPYSFEDFCDDSKILMGLDGDSDTGIATNVSIEKPKKPAKKKKPKKSTKLSPFENDCVLVLMSLGVKKSTAKTDVKSFLNNKNITTVEEFLQKYMKERANVKNT